MGSLRKIKWMIHRQILERNLEEKIIDGCLAVVGFIVGVIFIIVFILYKLMK